jgi:hypothetical protein
MPVGDGLTRQDPVRLVDRGCFGHVQKIAESLNITAKGQIDLRARVHRIWIAITVGSNHTAGSWSHVAEPLVSQVGTLYPSSCS